MNSIQIFGAAMLIVLIIAGMPLLLIWALNQLFNLSIQYTFLNWIAMIIVGSFLKIVFTTVKSNNTNIFNTGNKNGM